MTPSGGPLRAPDDYSIEAAPRLVILFYYFPFFALDAPQRLHSSRRRAWALRRRTTAAIEVEAAPLSLEKLCRADLILKAAVRTVEAVCLAIGEILQLFTREECLSYLANAGYGRS